MAGSNKKTQEHAMKTTPLHKWHTEQQANMAVFGEYHMPMWYPTGTKTEHLSVLRSAGLFDTSHMAVVLVSGTGAFDLLQQTFTNDLSACIGPAKRPLSSGRSVYGAFLNEKGHVIDDAILFQLASNRYMVVVNAGTGADVARHLADNEQSPDKTIISDQTDRIGKIDIQGPEAAKILSAVLNDPDNTFKAMPYFSFKGYFEEADLPDNAVRFNNGTPLLVSRTGYTGEFGFELFVQADKTLELWDDLLSAGETFSLIPCGLAARDSLRTGALLPLSHQDIGCWPFCNHPWDFALPWNGAGKGFTKSFIGSRVLRETTPVTFTLPFAGFDLRKVSSGKETVVLDESGTTIGTVLTCATDMGIGRVGDHIFSLASRNKPEGFKAKGLSCGFVKISKNLPAGTLVYLKNKRRKLKVMIVDDIRPDRTARRSMEAML